MRGRRTLLGNVVNVCRENYPIGLLALSQIGKNLNRFRGRFLKIAREDFKTDIISSELTHYCR